MRIIEYSPIGLIKRAIFFMRTFDEPKESEPELCFATAHSSTINVSEECAFGGKLVILGFSPQIFFHFDLSHFRYLLRPKYEPQRPQ